MRFDNDTRFAHAKPGAYSELLLEWDSKIKQKNISRENEPYFFSVE